MVPPGKAQKVTPGTHSQPGNTEHRQEDSVHLRHLPCQPEAEHTAAYADSEAEELLLT